jgi:hypothetical protein
MSDASGMCEGEKKCRILVRIREGRRPFGKLRSKLEDSIKTDVE